MKFSMQIIIMSLIVAIIAGGCAAKTKIKEQVTDDIRYNRAKTYFDNEKYYKALEELDYLRFGMSIYADDAHLLSAKIHIITNDYPLAITDLNTLLSQYRHSEFKEEASFLRAEAMRLNAPRVELDQEDTYNAIDTYNEFLELYPFSKYVDSVKVGLEYCYERLAHKAYNAAYIYYRLGQDSSIFIYADKVRNDLNLSNTEWAYWCYYLEAKAYYRSGNYVQAEKNIQLIIKNSNSEKLMRKAKKLLKKIERM